jgi:hypothetical protein
MESSMKKGRAECPNSDNASKRTIHGRKQDGGLVPGSQLSCLVILSLFSFQDFFNDI